MVRVVLRGLSLCVLMACLPRVSSAQSFLLDLPLRSQAAEVSQRIGITDITIKYHRPLVGDRKIWDGVVPYGRVWRAGANINTTISFSDPVMIDGKSLEKGTYGLHILPNADEWTIIFSKNSTSWGSFSYDQSEDALRINVKPRAADMHEALTFDFDQVQADSAVVELEWEKIAVSFKVSVDVHSLMLASLKRQLRTLSGYTWTSWNDAANYLLAEKGDLDEALTYADRSIKMEDRFDNEMTKAKVLTALDRKDEASTAQKKALDVATPRETDQFAHELLAEKHNEEAFAIFRDNAAKHPGQWFVHEGLTQMYSEQGKFSDAEREIKVALTGAPDSEKARLEGLRKKLEAKQPIN